MSFFLKLPEKLAPVAGVLSAAKFSLKLLCSFCSWRRRSFLSRQNFIPSLQLTSLHCYGAKLDVLGSCWHWSFTGPWPCLFFSWCLLACTLGRWPWGQYWSTSFICKTGRLRVFSSAAVVFRINIHQFLYSSSELSISAWIDHQRSSWKKHIRSDFSRAPS